MTIYCQVCFSLDSPMKKLSLESRNILEILLGKQLKNYGTDPSVCFLCDHLLYKTRTLRDTCIKSDYVWRSYAEMMEGPCATDPDLYLSRQHTSLRRIPFMNITKTSNLCLYNNPNINVESSMQIITYVKGQVTCFNNLTQHDQMSEPFVNTCEQNLFPALQDPPPFVLLTPPGVDPLSGNGCSGFQLLESPKFVKMTPKVTVKSELSIEYNSENPNNRSVDNNFVELEIKVEPPDIDEDLSHLQHDDSDPPIAENNVISKEQVVDSQVGNAKCKNAKKTTISKRKTLNSNEERTKCCEKDTKSFQCEICKKNFASQTNLKAHILSHSDVKLFECVLCQKRFSWKRSLQRHIITHNVSKPYDCEICKKSFTDPRYIKSHLLIHSGVKPYECEVCKKRFTDRGNFKSHLKIHSGNKPYECEICNKTFLFKRNLKSHLFIHSDIKPYECEICKKRFTIKSNLKCHFVTHGDSSLNECVICKKTFASHGNLKSHLLIHSGGSKQYECEICKKSFTWKRDYKRHSVVHSDSKPYECEICQKGFNFMSNLKSHMLTHSGIKPYSCEICKNSFTTQSYLKSHLMNHCGSKSYECEICKMTFTGRKNLKKHILIHS